MSKKKAKNNLGGRPRLHSEIQKRRNIALSDSLADKAKKIGEGSISAGIRIAIKSHDKQAARNG